MTTFRQLSRRLQGLPPESLREENSGGFGASLLSPEEIAEIDPGMVAEIDETEEKLDKIGEQNAHRPRRTEHDPSCCCWDHCEVDGSADPAAIAAIEADLDRVLGVPGHSTSTR